MKKILRNVKTWVLYSYTVVAILFIKEVYAVLCHLVNSTAVQSNHDLSMLCNCTKECK